MINIDYKKYKKDCLSFFQKLIQTPSVNGRENEKEIVSLIEKESKFLNLPYKIFEKEKDRPNIFVGENFSSDKDLLLVAHTDTVPEGDKEKWDTPPFSGEIINGKIYGRGALDCKGGIALSLYTLKALKDINKLHSAKFIGGVDEESGADSEFGIKYLLEQGLKAKGAVYTYGSQKRKKEFLTIGHRGAVRLWIICRGESAHSGSKEWQDRTKGENAIDGINELLNQLKNISFSGESKYFPSYGFVLTPTMISGGIGESIVPSEAKVLLDIRTLPKHNNEEIIKKIREITKKLENKRRFYEMKIKNNVSGALTDPQSDIVKKVVSLMGKIYQAKNPILKGSGPYNEAYMFIKAGIPTIIGFGPEGDGFHSINEYAEIDSMEKSFDFLTNLALKI